MPAAIIDGKAAAADLRARVTVEVARLGRDHQLVPGLAVVLVGADAASEIYVRHKVRETVAVGMRSFVHRLAADVSETGLLALIARLNADAGVHGILVQLPLPDHIDAARVTAPSILPRTLTAFTPSMSAAWRPASRRSRPARRQGAMLLLQALRADMAGLEAVVIGRSNIVGKPLAQLLLAANATVTVAHSRTRDLAAVARRADILVAAVGQAGAGARRLDQAGRNRYRRRHQPDCRPPAARPGWSATWHSRRRKRWRLPSRRSPAASGR